MYFDRNHYLSVHAGAVNVTLRITVCRGSSLPFLNPAFRQYFLLNPAIPPHPGYVSRYCHVRSVVLRVTFSKRGFLNPAPSEVFLSHIPPLKFLSSPISPNLFLTLFVIFFHHHSHFWNTTWIINAIAKAPAITVFYCMPNFTIERFFGDLWVTFVILIYFGLRSLERRVK